MSDYYNNKSLALLWLRNSVHTFVVAQGVFVKYVVFSKTEYHLYVVGNNYKALVKKCMLNVYVNSCIG